LSRWLQVPRLHGADDADHEAVSWLEHLVDLVFAAVFLRVGGSLVASPTSAEALAVAGLVVAIWSTWMTATLYLNRYDVDDALHRLLVFLQLAGVLGLALTVPDVLAGDPRGFALASAGVRGALALQYLRVHRQVPESRELSRRLGTLSVVDTALWLAAAAVPPPWTWFLWAAAIGTSITVPVARSYRAVAERYPLDRFHLARRFALVSLASLGVGLVIALVHPGATVASAGLILLIAAGAWWSYFGDLATRRPLETPSGAFFVWVYAHLPLVGALTLVGAGLTWVAVVPLHAPAPGPMRWLIGGSLAAVLVTVGLLDRVVEGQGERRHRKGRALARLAGAGTLLSLAGLGGALPEWVFLLAVGGVSLLQAVVVTTVTPLADLEPRRPSPAPAPTVATPRAPDDTPRRTAGRAGRPMLEGAVRIGAPSDLRRDLYFYLMQGSWLRFFGLFVGLYLAFNVVFAGLYLLDPSSVSNLAEGSFIDAFAFSVQTMSTIGYGAMSPVSDYAHLLVTAQAGLAVIFVALMTGLIFAKASRPRAHVLFSDVVSVAPYQGQPTLMLRVGNARGNEVVEATMRVSALLDSTSSEGFRMRRIHDLPLVRDSSPVFTLSWTVMHTIDDASCLAPFLTRTPDGDEGDQLVGIICVLMGFDSTYGQTIHARQTYYFPEDFRLGERFVDVVTPHDDGHISVDFNRFHDTYPVSESEAPPG